MQLTEDCKYCANFFCTHCWHCRTVTKNPMDGDYCCKSENVTPNYLAYVRAMEFIHRLSDEEKQAFADAFNIPKVLLWEEEEIND